MFDNGFFGILGMVGAYFVGKDQGEKKMQEYYEYLLTKKEQQDQIALLNKKLDNFMNKGLNND